MSIDRSRGLRRVFATAGVVALTACGGAVEASKIAEDGPPDPVTPAPDASVAPAPSPGPTLDEIIDALVAAWANAPEADHDDPLYGELPFALARADALAAAGSDVESLAAPSDTLVVAAVALADDVVAWAERLVERAPLAEHGRALRDGLAMLARVAAEAAAHLRSRLSEVDGRKVRHAGQTLVLPLPAGVGSATTGPFRVASGRVTVVGDCYASEGTEVTGRAVRVTLSDLRTKATYHLSSGSLRISDAATVDSWSDLTVTLSVAGKAATDALYCVPRVEHWEPADTPPMPYDISTTAEVQVAIDELEEEVRQSDDALAAIAADPESSALTRRVALAAGKEIWPIVHRFADLRTEEPILIEIRRLDGLKRGGETAAREQTWLTRIFAEHRPALAGIAEILGALRERVRAILAHL